MTIWITEYRCVGQSFIVYEINNCQRISDKYVLVPGARRSVKLSRSQYHLTEKEARDDIEKIRARVLRGMEEELRLIKENQIEILPWKY